MKYIVYKYDTNIINIKILWYKYDQGLNIICMNMIKDTNIYEYEWYG